MIQQKQQQQLTLPLFENDDISYKDKVRQSWSFTFSKQFITSVYSKRVISLAIGQIKDKDKINEVYHIRAADLIRQTDLSRQAIYRHMKDVIYELSNICFYFDSESSDTIIPRHLLDTTRYENPVEYRNGILTIAFNPALHNLITELSHYSQYELDAYLKFSSWYSMRIWELLSAYKDTGWWRVEIDQYRDLMGCGPTLNDKGKPVNKNGKAQMKYPQNGDLVKHTTKEPLEELKDTELEFKVTPLFEKKTSNGRPSISHLLFELVNKPISIKDQIKLLHEKDVDFAKVYETLKKWSITDENIAKYASAIGKQRIYQLNYAWMQRNMPGAKLPIINKEKFCNKVFIEEGEKALNSENIDLDLLRSEMKLIN